MHIHRLKRLLSVLVAACLCTASMSAFAAKEIPQAYHIVLGGTDANGNYVPEYTVDANGNRVEFPSSGTVRAASGADLPSKWDSRDYGWVTSVKNQGRSNCCWAFASVGALETSYVKQGFGSRTNTDFSEAHLAWFGLRHRTTDKNDPTYGDGIMYANPFIQGGEWRFMASALMRGCGAQLEQNAPWYLQTDSVSNLGSVLMQHMTQSESSRYDSYAKLWSAEEIIDRSRETTKKRIMENGAVMMSYWHDGRINGYGELEDPYLNSTSNGYYRGIYGGTNHSVLVVGWDDSFSRLNFTGANNLHPNIDGAWLVKSSWGTSHADHGYYWLSYAEPSIQKIVAVKAARSDAYSRIYQYDGSFPTTFFNQGSGSGMGNMFTAKRDELLTHVAFFNMNETPVDVRVEVYLYTGNVANVDPDHMPNELRRFDNASVTLHDIGYGYFTAELAEPVLIRQGEHFLTSVKFISPSGDKVIVPVEGVTVDNPPEGVVTYTGNLGESFVYLDGDWYDTNDVTYLYYDFNNVPVKAMTRDPDLVEPKLTELSAPDHTEYYIGQTVDLTGLALNYINEYGEQITVTEGFTCSETAFTTPGVHTVTVTYGSLTYTFDVYVARMPGDVDGDGEITAKDVTIMRRFLAGWHGITLYEANFDVNADGKMTLMDVALVTRFLVGGYNVVLL